MDYTISDLLSGARVMANSVFGRRSEYTLQFNHEDDGKWYVDFPGWPFDHHNLMMVAGADKLCAFLSDDDRFAHINVVPSNTRLDLPGYACLEQGEHSLTGGSIYMVTGLPGFEREIWLCPVTLFVLGRYPKFLYIRKAQHAATA
ncbi:MAG: hypothetical protein IKR25_12610 [Muribaculaceae bacterium]|nr:hypothetical protein [Muribaculaceae bacterium]